MEYGSMYIAANENIDIYVNARLHQRISIRYKNRENTADSEEKRLIVNIPVGAVVEIIAVSAGTKNLKDRFVFRSEMSEVGLYDEPIHFSALLI